MDEEITIINTKTRNEKIKNFFVNNKKKLIIFFAILTLIPLSFYSYQIYTNQLTGEIPAEVCELIESNNLNMDWLTNGNNLINTCE